MQPSVINNRVLPLVKQFYRDNPQIKESHGIKHVMAVYRHTINAIHSQRQGQSNNDTSNDDNGRPTHVVDQYAAEIEAAALLHDVDDSKYFPHNWKTKPNAKHILQQAGISSPDRVKLILDMIDWVSTSHNGNTVPETVQKTGNYCWLIPRWADRLEAVGTRGVLRAYQYSVEHNEKLCSSASPRATTEEQVWELAYTGNRFEAYQNGKDSPDMISHYYDKLLHVARPPPSIVQNAYLEEQAQASAAALVEVCLRFGRTGKVDEEYIRGLEASTS